MSLIFFILSLFLDSVKSHNVSIAELKPSAVKTRPMHKRMMSHSIGEIEKIRAAVTTNPAITR